MSSVLLTGPFVPFTFALGLLLGLFLLELVFLLIGGSLLSSDTDVAVPDAPDLADLDLDLDFDGLDVAEADLEVAAFEEAAPEVSGGLAAWLGIGRVPTLIWLASLLLGFGLTGTALQIALQTALGWALPAGIAGIPAGVAGIWFARSFGGLFAALLPQSESESISERSLGRRKGVISQGTASAGRPAEVRVTDGYGNQHHLRAEPLRPQETLTQGTEVLVLRDRRSGAYRLIALSDG